MIEKESLDKLKKRVNILEKKINKFYGDSDESGLKKIPLDVDEFLLNSHWEAEAFAKQPQDPFTFRTHVYNEEQKEPPADLDKYRDMVVEQVGLCKLANQLVYDLFSVESENDEEVLSLQKRIFNLDIFFRPGEFLDFEFRNFMCRTLHSDKNKKENKPSNLIDLHEWHDVLLLDTIKPAFDDLDDAFFDRPATNKNLMELFEKINYIVTTDKVLLNRYVGYDFAKKKKYTYWLLLLETFFKKYKHEYTGDIDLYLFNCNLLVENSSNYEWAIISCPTASWKIKYSITDDNCLTIPINEEVFVNFRENYVAGTSSDRKFGVYKFGIGNYLYPVSIFDYRQY